MGTRVPRLVNSLTCCAQLMTRRACVHFDKLWWPCG